MSQTETQKTIFIVDDEESIRTVLSIMLTQDGYDVVSFESPVSALKKITKDYPNIIISDISMPEMNGIEFLSKVKNINQEAGFIVLTAYGSTESAVEAMKLGASDYLTKPFKVDEVKICVKSALNTIQLNKENRVLRSALAQKFSFENIIGNSQEMHEIYDLIKRVSQTNSSVLIYGESGTGKEMIAHAIHRNSPFSTQPFVTINCAAIPETLFESELFGHTKGAFTGAASDKRGIFQEAEGGTLFLDEVGEIPISIQAKLLRAIQQKSFRPLGASKDVNVNIRLICATNRNLEEEIKKGTFREDLFYRINVIQIKLPPLRDRKEDIKALSEHFLTKYTLSMGKNIKSISQEAMKVLMNYSYPGNIRELENIIERAVALESKNSIFPESLPSKIFSLETMQAQNQGKIIHSLTSISEFNLEKGVEEYERQHIINALKKTNGVKKKAAKLLGITFRSLRYRIDKYGIEDPNPHEDEG